MLLAAKTLAGISSGPLNPVIDTVFFERVPDGLRGRVFGVVSASAWLAMPLGVLVAGPAIEWAGLRATLVVTGALYLGVVFAAMKLPSLRGLDDRPPAQPPATAGKMLTVSPSETSVSRQPRLPSSQTPFISPPFSSTRTMLTTLSVPRCAIP